MLVGHNPNPKDVRLMSRRSWVQGGAAATETMETPNGANARFFFGCPQVQVKAFF